MCSQEPGRATRSFIKGPGLGKAFLRPQIRPSCPPCGLHLPPALSSRLDLVRPPDRGLQLPRVMWQMLLTDPRRTSGTGKGPRDPLSWQWKGWGVLTDQSRGGMQTSVARKAWE